MELKECISCKKVLSINSFHKDKSRKSGLREKCKTCRCKFPEGNLETKCLACNDSFIITNQNAKAQKYCSLTCQKMHIRYGISEYQLEDMLIESDYKCMICGNEETNIDKRTGKAYALSVDHCHETGNIRGVLCTCCNNALGQFKDNIEYLQNAVQYLQKSKECPRFNAKVVYQHI